MSPGTRNSGEESEDMGIPAVFKKSKMLYYSEEKVERPDYAWVNQEMESLVSSGKYMASSDMSGIEFYRFHQ